jgi:hypothetical protein
MLRLKPFIVSSEWKGSLLITNCILSVALPLARHLLGALGLDPQLVAPDHKAGDRLPDGILVDAALVEERVALLDELVAC